MAGRPPATYFDHDGGTAHGDVTLTLADLAAGDAPRLRATHADQVAEGWPAPAGAVFLSGWFAGMLAGPVGFGVAAAGAGFVVDPGQVRWQVAPEGWPTMIDLGRPIVVVDTTHPWAGLPGVEAVASSAVVLERTVTALAAASEPLVAACHGLARVGRAGLWNEVGDRLGMALAHQTVVPVTPAMVAVLEAATRVPGVPWRAQPVVGPDASVNKESLERLPEIDADWLVEATGSEGMPRAAYEEVAASPLYQAIPAVKAGRVHVVDANLWPGFGHLWARALVDDLERLFVN